MFNVLSLVSSALYTTSYWPPINPTPRLYLRITWIYTLPWATWEAVTGVKGCYDTRWLTGLRSTQAKVEGIVLKAAWQWGSDCTVVNDPLGNQAAPHCM
jgi:hypothetical protein